MNMVVPAITMVVGFMSMFMVGMLLLLARPCLGDVVVVMVYMARLRNVVDVMVHMFMFMFMSMGVAVAVPCCGLLQLPPHSLAPLLLLLQLLCCCGFQPGLVNLYVHGV
jgi:hypothetical protein